MVEVYKALVRKDDGEVGDLPYIENVRVVEYTDYAALEAENARLRDRVAELDKALEPFANLANSYDGIPPRKYFGDTDGELRYYDEHKTLVEIGYLRAARRAREGGKVDG